MKRSTFYEDARTDLSGPLVGIRVVEATTTWAGPMCGCVMADFGAEVIKVEHPEGEVARRLPPFLNDASPPLGFMHATVNRNKQSLSLDLSNPTGRDVFLALARTADIVIENFRPGVMDRLGLGFTALREQKPDLILVSISGYGQFGPDRDRVGYDPLAQAASGYASLNGEPDGEPVKSPTFLADDLGGLHGALAALAALRHRDRTGEGQWIDVALLDAMLFQSNGYLTLANMGIDLPRLGNEFRIAAPANRYRCRDGSVMAGVLLDSHWRLLAAHIGKPELAEHPSFATAQARLSNRDEVNQLVGEWIAQRNVDDVVRSFSEAGVPVAPIRSYAEAAVDPHVLEREMLQTPDDGEIALTGPVAKLSRTPSKIRSAAPELGQHNREILESLGFDGDEIDRLREAGVIG